MKKILFALLCATLVAPAIAAVNKPTADSVCCIRFEQIPVPTPTPNPTPDKKGHYS